MRRHLVAKKTPQLTREEQEALDLHNKARREALGGKRPPLMWCSKLAEEAAAYALKQAQEGIRGHDPQNAITSQGENLLFISHAARITTADPRPTYIPESRSLAYFIQCCLDEKKYYRGQKLRTDDPSGVEEQWGHYCTIIWPEATRVGMARFMVPPGDRRYKLQGTFFVAKYDVRPLVGWSAWSGVRNEVMQLYDAEKSCDKSGRHEKTEIVVRPDGTKVIRKIVTQFVMAGSSSSGSSGKAKRDSK